MPPTTPATGPDISRLTGRAVAPSAVATPLGDGLDAGVLQLPHLRACLLFVEWHEDAAVVRDPLGHREPVAAPDDRVALPRQVLVVREVERLLVARDVEDVPV